MTDIIPYLIVCPLVFVAGFIDAIAGGGGLISIPAYILAGLPVHFALGTNKFSSTMGTAIATYQYARKGYIKPGLAIPAIIFALIGATIGSNIAMSISDELFKVFMLIILPFIALYVTFHKKWDYAASGYSKFLTRCIIVALCFLIGMYDGFYGPGTGTFLMLALTGIAHLTIHDAAGLTKTTNLTSNITALAVFVMNDVVLFQLGIAAAVFSILGNYMGARSFTRNGVVIVRPTIFIVLTIFFFKLCYDLWFS